MNKNVGKYLHNIYIRKKKKKERKKGKKICPNEQR